MAYIFSAHLKKENEGDQPAVLVPVRGMRVELTRRN